MIQQVSEPQVSHLYVWPPVEVVVPTVQGRASGSVLSAWAVMASVRAIPMTATAARMVIFMMRLLKTITKNGQCEFLENTRQMRVWQACQLYTCSFAYVLRVLGKGCLAMCDNISSGKSWRLLMAKDLHGGLFRQCVLDA